MKESKQQADRVFRQAMRSLGWSGTRLWQARTFAMRLRGMIGRPPDASMSMAFPRCRSVHTWFMAYPLDIAFIDVEGKILEVDYAVRPFRTVACPRAWGVLERAAGHGGRKILKKSVDSCPRFDILIKP